ncbi:MAG: sulfatase-like hydrolase/transferase [Candidatus Binatia bacterium]|nr:sulfatase-like hydrolase/transferase [Candidatus Binatia bacterium]MDG2008637.1 sulfatase-like hydrolase/transferase [Candidatus Binatia bacterium]
MHSVQWMQRLGSIEAASGDIPYRRESAHFRTLPRELARRGYVSFEGGKFWEGTYLDAGFTSGMATSCCSGFFSSVGDQFGREGIGPFRDFLDTTEGAPFFAWLAPKLPHSPFNAADTYRARFWGLGLSNWTIEYLANLLWMDDVLGEVLAELESRGLHENTLIVYASDNGWQLGSPGAALGGQPRGKTSIYEQGFRTSLVFSLPDTVPAGVLRDDLVSMVDLFPTLLDFGGLPQVSGRWGRTLLPNIVNGTPTGTDHLVGEAEVRLNGEPAATTHHFVRGLDWRYVHNSDGTEEIYSINEDPDELSNQIAERSDILPEARAAVADFENKLSTPAALLDVAGRFVDVDAEPVAGIGLQLKGRSPEGRLLKLRTITGPSGYFRFPNLPHGTYTLSSRRRFIQRGELVYRGQAERRLEISLPWAQHGAYLPLVGNPRSEMERPGQIGLQGQVVDQNGLPVAGAMLSTPVGYGRWLDVLSDQEGKFDFDFLNPGVARIRVSRGPVRGSKVVSVEIGDESPAPIVIQVKRRR